jgi:hypothetical protein
MTTVLDILFLRRPKLNYISPAICESIFSGTGSPIIILPEIGKLLGPTGVILGSRGNKTLSWNRYPGALCYNVYTAVLTDTDILEPCSGLTSRSQSLQYTLLFECLDVPFVDITQYGCYRVSAITGEGETDLSDPYCTCEHRNDCPPGQQWDPFYLDCVCSDPICPTGQTWDAVQCKCVSCGTQNCPPGFFPQPGDPCLCIPSTFGPLTIFNSEQTAYCDPLDPEQGSKTIAAGTFSVVVHNPTADRVATAQTEMNNLAYQEAQDELVCGADWSSMTWECFPTAPFPDQIEYIAECDATGNHWNLVALNSMVDPAPECGGESQPACQITGCAVQAEGTLAGWSGPETECVIDFSTTLTGPNSFCEVAVIRGDTFEFLFNGGSADPGSHTFFLPATETPINIFITVNVQPVNLPIPGNPGTHNGAAFCSGTVSNA